MPKISIIVPVWNQLEETKKCVRSIKKYTSDYELIIVNNASNDETTEWLKGLHTESMIDDEGNDLGWIKNLKIIHNKENLGWIGAVNQGFDQSQGEYLVMMNNDVYVSENWADKLLKAFNVPVGNVGAVGPVTNRISGKQIDKCNRKNVVYEEAKTLIGFCMMIKREIYDSIGGLDTLFGMGHSDDLDYSLRIRKLGYKLIIARDCWVFHDCSVSMKKAFTPEEYQEDLNKKLELLRKKWGEYEVQRLLMEEPSGTIAIPHLEMMHSRFVTSLISMKKPPKVNIVFGSGTVVPAVRENLVEQAEGDWLLFIDSDMLIPPDALIRLLAHDLPVVSGLCFRRVPPYNPTLYKANGDGHSYSWMQNWNNDELIEVDATGAAFLLVRKYVLDQLPRPLFRYTKIGEDIQFCEAIRKLGYKIYVDPKVKIGHLSQMSVDENTYKMNNGLVG